ncbi:hypothetical protein ABK040_007632 [Willaertia magna]
MSNFFNVLENASSGDPLEIASKVKKETKEQQKPKFQEEKKPQTVQNQRGNQQQRRRPTEGTVVNEEGFESTRTRGRGGRQQHGYQPPKTGRKFDRHVSGTGAKKGEVKKGGRGKANWGVAGEEEKKEATTTTTTEQTTTETSESVGEQQTTQEGEQTPTTPTTEEKKEEPKDNNLTLDEYLKSRTTRNIVVKKEKGEELQTSKTVKVSDNAFVREEEKKREKKVSSPVVGETENKSKKPQSVQISAFLDDAGLEQIKQRSEKQLLEGPKREFRGTRGRGGRGRGRGGAKNTSGNRKPKPTKLNNEEFPTLGQVQQQ